MQAGSFALAIGLLYLALRNVDLGDLWTRIRTASFLWLLPLTLFVFISHYLRAWRWQVLISALPDSRGKGATVTKLFGALMVGYMVNYAAPRIGELVRTSIAARATGHRFAAVLGTVVAERLLDVICLALALVSVLALLKDQIRVLVSSIAVPGFLAGPTGVALLLLAIVLPLIAVYLYRQKVRSAPGSGRAQRLVESFVAGLQTLLRSERAGTIVFSTLLMWSCYLVMAYIPLRMLGMTDAFDVGLVDAWSLMNIGALGVVVPAPGGTGTYHYITQLALTGIWSVDSDVAAAYAIITHAIQMLLYVAAGFISLVGLGIGLSAIIPSGGDVDQSS
ncbi:MAG: flippase-like domain-containing protein [Rhodothermales bacterium]|nr:flippase-like domain-containing protein [Rhodothermales bacterium]